MASDEDNFDIDIYGDGIEETAVTQNDSEETVQGQELAGNEEPPESMTYDGAATPIKNEDGETSHKDNASTEDQTSAQKIATTDNSATEPVQLPKAAPQTQGVSREKGVNDDRPLDPGATTALMVNDLHWWITDDDIRGWANQCRCEDELVDITFSEHKVNGKSKGQAYISFNSPQAATATKHKIDTFGDGPQQSKTFSATYTNPYTNPFKTLPKDGPARNTGPNSSRPTPNNFGSSGSNQSNGGYSNTGGYRGGRGGGFNNRGGMNNGGGFNRGGFNSSGSASFQNSGVGGFQNNNNSMGYGGFNNNRGGMMGGMRGGAGMRGGRGNMMSMPFGGMAFGMGMGMNMPQMAMGMPGPANFGGAFNPAMFNQQQQGGAGDQSWNPHGTKRTRHE